jgi:hypothetical protein
MPMTTYTIGLATYRAIVTLYEPSREFLLDETDPEERALQSARVRFLDSARLTNWKAMLPIPTCPTDRALLAEDLMAWGSLPGLADFEFERNTQNLLIRHALMNLSDKLTGVNR